MKNKNIYLCGFMGVGKTTIAQEISRVSGYKFIDLDKEIEIKENESINNIFENKGEKYFRSLEFQILKYYSGFKNQIISTGGGILLNEENREIIKNTGVSVYLKASPEKLIERINCETRPLLKQLTKNELYDKIIKILSDREIFYKSCDYIINTDNYTPLNSAQKILDLTS